MNYSAFINAILTNIEFDVSDYVFSLHGVYNTEFLLNVFEELIGISNHTIEIIAGEK